MRPVHLGPPDPSLKTGGQIILSCPGQSPHLSRHKHRCFVLTCRTSYTFGMNKDLLFLRPKALSQGKRVRGPKGNCELSIRVRREGFRAAQRTIETCRVITERTIAEASDGAEKCLHSTALFTMYASLLATTVKSRLQSSPLP